MSYKQKKGRRKLGQQEGGRGQRTYLVPPARHSVASFRPLADELQGLPSSS